MAGARVSGTREGQRGKGNGESEAGDSWGGSDGLQGTG